MMQWIVRDWGTKLIALVLAIGLWYYAVGEETIEVTRMVPLEVSIKNPKMSILEQSARAIQITLVAPRALLSDLTSEKIRAVHEIGGEVKTTGDYSFRVEEREVQRPTMQISVKDIYPPVIHVTLDELITQKLVIKPEFLGEPAFGYKMAQNEVQLNPNTVLVEGPKGALENLDGAVTEKVDLIGRIRSFRKTVSLNLPSSIRILSESQIDVHVPIREEFAEKSYANVMVKILGVAAGGAQEVELEPSKISFVLKGSRRELAVLTSEKILAYADIASLENGEHTVPVQFVLPEDVSLKQEAPLQVKAIIKRK